MYRFFEKNRKGMALLVVMTSIVVITVMVVELGYSSRMSVSITANYRDEVVATYLAKSSVNIALLRIAITSKIKSLEVGGMKIPPQIISIITKMPFIFPPPKELLALGGIGGELDLGMRVILEEIEKGTNISSVGRFDHSILSKDSRININMAAADEEKAMIFKEQMKNLYAARLLEDESLAHRYSMEDFDVLLNNILDWIDEDSESRNGGDEGRYYYGTDPQYGPRNAPIPTISELHMVTGMNDEIFNLIRPMISIFSGDGVNVNEISEDMWRTIESRFTDEDIELLMERIDLIGFSDENELRTWVGENTRIPATEFNPLKISLAFDDENFKIEARGYSGRVSKNIAVYVSSTYKNLLIGGSGAVSEPEVSNLKPDVVYWEIQ